MNCLLGAILFAFVSIAQGQPNQNGGGEPSRVIIGMPPIPGLSALNSRVLVLPSSDSIVRWAGDPRGPVKVDTQATLLKQPTGTPVRALGLGTSTFRDSFGRRPSTTWSAKQNPPQDQRNIARGKIPSFWPSSNPKSGLKNQGASEPGKAGNNVAVELGGPTNQNPPQQTQVVQQQQSQQQQQQQPSENPGNQQASSNTGQQPPSVAGQQPPTAVNGRKQETQQIVAQQPDQRNQAQQPQHQTIVQETQQQNRAQQSLPQQNNGQNLGFRNRGQWRNTAQQPSLGNGGDPNSVSQSIFFNPNSRTNGAVRETMPSGPTPNKAPNMNNQPINREQTFTLQTISQPSGRVRTRPLFVPAAKVFMPAGNAPNNNNNNNSPVSSPLSQPVNNPNPPVESSDPLPRIPDATRPNSGTTGQIQYIGTVNVGLPPAGTNGVIGGANPPINQQRSNVNPATTNQQSLDNPQVAVDRPNRPQTNTINSPQSNNQNSGATNQNSNIPAKQPGNIQQNPSAQVNPPPQQTTRDRGLNPTFPSGQGRPGTGNLPQNRLGNQGNNAVTAPAGNPVPNQGPVNPLSPVPRVNPQQGNLNAGRTPQNQATQTLFALPPEILGSFPAGMDGQMILNRIASQFAQGRMNHLIGTDTEPTSIGVMNPNVRQLQPNAAGVNNPMVQTNPSAANRGFPQSQVNPPNSINNQGQSRQGVLPNQGTQQQSGNRQFQRNPNNNIPTAGGVPPMLPQRPPVRQTGLPRNTQSPTTFANRPIGSNPSAGGREIPLNNLNGPLLGRSWAVSGTGNENAPSGLNNNLLFPMIQTDPSLAATTPEPTEAPEVEGPEPTAASPGNTAHNIDLWQRLGRRPPGFPPGMLINRQTAVPGRPTSNQQAPPVPNTGAGAQRPNFLNALWPNRFSPLPNRNPGTAPDAQQPNTSRGPQQAGPFQNRRNNQPSSNQGPANKPPPARPNANLNSQQSNNRGSQTGRVQPAWVPPSQTRGNQQQPIGNQQQPNTNNNQQPPKTPPANPTTTKPAAPNPNIQRAWTPPTQNRNQQTRNGGTNQGPSGNNNQGQQQGNNQQQWQSRNNQQSQNQEGQIPGTNSNNPMNGLMFPGMVNGGNANPLNPLLGPQGSAQGMNGLNQRMASMALQRRFLDQACGPSKILQQNYQRQYMRYMNAQQQRRQAQMAMFQNQAGGTGMAGQTANPSRTLTKRRRRQAPNPFMSGGNMMAAGNTGTGANTMPGGMNPSGMMPGGMIPGAMMPDGMIPGAVMPDGMMPGAVMPGGMMPGANTLPGANMMQFAGMPLTAPESPEINYQCMAAESCGTTPHERTQAMHRTPQSEKDCQSRSTGLLCCLG